MCAETCSERHCHPVLLHDGDFPAVFLVATLRPRERDAVTTFPIQRWQEKMGGARWRKRGGMFSGNRVERRQVQGRSQRGTGKVSKKAFLNDGLPYDFSKPGR